jgi:hypothetical protein
MIVNNLATDIGGGISLDDALNVQIVNNTVARNISTATSEDADRTSCNPAPFGSCPHGAGLTSERHSQTLIDIAITPNQQNKPSYCTGTVNCSDNFSNPALFNNVFWQNQAYYLNGSADLFDGGLTSAGYIDFEVLAPATGHYHATYSDCTASSVHCASTGGDNNIFSDPAFIQQVSLDFAAFAFAADPSFITVVIKSKPSDPQGDYHLQSGSPAIDEGTNQVGGLVAAPDHDYDADARPQGGDFDVGADEVVAGTEAPLGHIGDLDGTGANISSSRWRATVTVTVHLTDHTPVSGATITGTWSAGDSSGRTLTCTTDGTGSCTVQSGRLRRTSNASVTFTVTAVIGSVTYDPGANHDPDGDSNGTAITVNRP